MSKTKTKCEAVNMKIEGPLAGRLNAICRKGGLSARSLGTKLFEKYVPQIEAGELIVDPRDGKLKAPTEMAA